MKALLTGSRAARRETVLRVATLLRAAAGQLEAHARACTDAEAPAHDVALKRALGMVRAAVGVAGKEQD